MMDQVITPLNDVVTGLDVEMDLGNTTLTVKTMDRTFDVDKQILMQSGFIRDALMNDPNETTIELKNKDMSSSIFEKVIKYLTFHLNNPAKEIDKPLKSDKLIENNVCEWDVAFIDLEDDDLFNLLLTANYLNIPSLLALSCAKLASFMKNKSIEEIKERFHIETPVPDETKLRIKAENAWVNVDN